jgi:hypothetical protein
VVAIALVVGGSIMSSVAGQQNNNYDPNGYPFDTPNIVFGNGNGDGNVPIIEVTPAEPIAMVTPTPTPLLGNLIVPRVGHSAELLGDNRVLVAGGWSESTVVASAELFDPTSRQFSVAGDMTEARADFTATVLTDGRVLLVGGRGSNNVVLASAELFDPRTAKFTKTAGLRGARTGHTATVLTNGKVLIVGGSDGTADLSTAELYDPTIGKFTPTGSMHVARQGHTATLLYDDRVLIAGGKNQDTAEIYDPVTGEFTDAGHMSSVHADAGAVLLLDGRVMIAGGEDNGHASAAIDLWSPATFKWSASHTGLLSPRAASSLTLLRDGNVMSIGGVDEAGIEISSIEVYAPVLDRSDVTREAGMPVARHTATMLWDGSVLITGGGYGNAGSNSSELIEP